MLRELRIRDVAIIERLEVEFGPGLNVLSGETGAGKSIILGALGLILGARASSDLVRTGCTDAEVQARVDRSPEVEELLAELDLAPPAEDEGLLLRRVLTRAGRSRAYVGGVAVPVASLRTLASVLVDYSSQHEHQVLLDEATHLRILDRFGGLTGLREQVGAAVQALRGLLAERERLAGLEREQRAREDYLRFQLDELEEAELVEDELEELESRRLLLRSAEERSGAAREAEEALYSGAGAAVERLGQAARRLTRLAELDPAVQEIAQGVEEALIAAEEAGRDLGDYARRARSNPRELAELEDRVALLRRLGRKHRCAPGALIEIRDRMRGELDELAGLEGRLEDLRPRIEEARRSALALARRLSGERREAAERLVESVETQLKSLAMAKACFRVRFDGVETGADQPGLGPDGAAPLASSTGLERAGFLLSANPGEEPKALSRVASGGELSRILLAIRRALADTSAVQTCVFDEVDSGLGGATADTLGRKLADISRQVQVLCITHLPQIAACADVHFRVDKIVSGGRTRTGIVRLDDPGVTEELVRMLAGTSETDGAERFARELQARARARI